MDRFYVVFAVIVAEQVIRKPLAFSGACLLVVNWEQMSVSDAMNCTTTEVWVSQSVLEMFDEGEQVVEGLVVLATPPGIQDWEAVEAEEREMQAKVRPGMRCRYYYHRCY